MNELIEKAKLIRCLICDLDGVLTDGLLHIDNAGNELKSFHVQDGIGLKLLMSAGIEVAIITGARTQLVSHRMQQLGITHCFMGQIDKQKAYETLKKNLNLDDKQMAYVGDDLPDLPIMRQVGLSVAVANGVRQIKEFADWQTELSGGFGAVREVCDLILHAQDKTDLALKRYLEQ